MWWSTPSARLFDHDALREVPGLVVRAVQSGRAESAIGDDPEMAGEMTLSIAFEVVDAETEDTVR